MRIASAALLAMALAACGQRSDNGQNMAGNSSLPGPRPATPPAGGSTPGPSSYQEGYQRGLRQSYRASALAGCASSFQQRAAQENVQLNVDVQALCTCIIDRMMAGVTADQLVNLRPGPREQEISLQCAREHGLAPGGGN